MDTVRFETQVDIQELKEYSEKVTRIKENNRTERDNNCLVISDALFSGKVVINVAETIRLGEYFEDGFPKIGIGAATHSILRCTSWGTSISFAVGGGWFGISGTLLAVEDTPGFLQLDEPLHAETLVPVVPPDIRPKDGLGGYMVLFEVSEWKPVPAVVDPILCKRLHGDYFTVEATWDMTELEAFVTGL